MTHRAAPLSLAGTPLGDTRHACAFFGGGCRHDHAVVCSYRQAQVSGDAMVDILRTHPMVIVGGILRRNPFFIPPDRFIAELRQRRATQRTS